MFSQFHKGPHHVKEFTYYYFGQTALGYQTDSSIDNAWEKKHAGKYDFLMFPFPVKSLADQDF